MDGKTAVVMWMVWIALAVTTTVIYGVSHRIGRLEQCMDSVYKSLVLTYAVNQNHEKRISYIEEHMQTQMVERVEIE